MHLPCIAAVRSTELKLLVLSSLSGRFFRLPSRCFVWCSPQRLEPPWVKGMFNNATPWREGPCAKSNGVPSHCEWEISRLQSVLLDEQNSLLILTIFLNDILNIWNIYVQWSLDLREDFYSWQQIVPLSRTQSTKVCSSSGYWISRDSFPFPCGILHRSRRPRPQRSNC